MDQNPFDLRRALTRRLLAEHKMAYVDVFLKRTGRGKTVAVAIIDHSVYQSQGHREPYAALLELAGRV